MLCLYALVLNVQFNNFFSQVRTEPMLLGYYQYFSGSKYFLHTRSRNPMFYLECKKFVISHRRIPCSLVFKRKVFR